MLEALLFLVQACQAAPCTIVRQEHMSIVTVCNADAVPNAAWQSTRVFATQNGEKVLVVRHSVCSAI